jgi:hypothetical protein
MIHVSAAAARNIRTAVEQGNKIVFCLRASDVIAGSFYCYRDEFCGFVDKWCEFVDIF